MIVRLFALILSIFATVNFGYAQKQIPEMDSLSGMSKPYVIVNLPSGECINCKLYAFSALRSLCKDKMVIVSDDRQMKSFLQRTSDVADSVKFIWSTSISNLLLADGSRGTICLVQNDTILKYPLDPSFGNDQLNYLKGIINKYCNTPLGSSINSGHLILKDSIINPNFSLYNFDNNNSYIFNPKFQTGLIVNSDTSLKYYNYDIDKKTEEKIYHLVSINSPEIHMLAMDDSVYTNSSAKVLRQTGLLKVNLISFNPGNVLFAYNTCYLVPSKYDTFIDLRVSKKYLLSLQDDALFSLDKSKNIYFVPDIVKKGKINYSLRSYKGYQYKDNKFYLPAYMTDSLGKASPGTNLYILRFKVGNNKIELDKVFDTKQLADSISEFFFRLDEDGIPFVVNKLGLYVLQLSNNQRIPFSRLTGNPEIYYLYDISISKDTIKYVGVLKSKTTVIGKYNLKTQTASSIEKLKGEELFSDAVIHENQIRVYMKNMKDDSIYFENYTF